MAKKRDVPKVLEAQAFVLRDSRGKVRAQLFSDDDYGPALWLLDSEEKHRLEIVLDRGGKPVICLMGKKQTPLVGIGGDETDGAGITIYHPHGMPALMIGTRVLDNSVSVSVVDKSGSVV